MWKKKVKGIVSVLVFCLTIWFIVEKATLRIAPQGTAPGAAIAPGIPVLGSVDLGDGRLRYIIDLAAYMPNAVRWEYRTVYGMYNGQQMMFLTGSEGTVKILYLLDRIFMDGVLTAESVLPYAYSSESKTLYACQEITSGGQTYLAMSPYACSEWPEELTLAAIAKEHVLFAMDREGNGGFYQLDSKKNLVKWDLETSKASASAQIRKLAYILAAAVLTMALVCAFAYRAVNGGEGRRLREYPKRVKRRAQRAKEGEGEFTYAEESAPGDTVYPAAEKRIDDYDIEVESYYYDIDIDDEDYEGRESGNRAKEPPVISVRGVTMVFYISTGNVSGIKEYLIQWVRGQVSCRELTALDHVSFDIFKGEVVGIIGTNGSGKSTLLRIISGAMHPTAGKVLIDRRKVQLLTLGTGFDLELSARENVYLNGAIIGYPKEFLDARYQEIVEFAELEGFMDEKVKNFSSGMVSRLGFAVATAGDAAEILILDEILSVGDEFFHKKSLKRIKEMIHGGSTVLMVSHSMGTILENCTKAVWIEKGKLMMVGETREVCGKYRAMNG